MTNFKDLVQRRRSHRKFTGEEITAEQLQLILRAALMSPTSKGRRDWHFAIVDNKTDIAKLSEAKESGARFVNDAPLVIVVMGDPDTNDCWVEDCSIATISMQYQIEELGLGSCWVQLRGRGLSDGHSADEVVHGILGLPDHLHVLCMLAIGHYTDERALQQDEDLKWENVIVRSDD